MNDFALEILLKYGQDVRRPVATRHDWYILMEWSSSRTAGEDAAGTMTERLEAFLSDCATKGLVVDAAIAQSQAQARNMWVLREGGNGAASRNPNPTCHFDISVSVNKIPDLIARVNAAALKAVPGVRPRPSGHMGDGNLHYNFTAPETHHEQGGLRADGESA